MSKKKRSKGGSYTPRTVGTFQDPKTGQTIKVRPKRGESTAAAMSRVKKKHGL